MKTLSGTVMFTRPVVKTSPEDNAWRLPKRAIVGSTIGNKPAGAYFTSVSREFVFVIGGDGKQAK